LAILGVFVIALVTLVWVSEEPSPRFNTTALEHGLARDTNTDIMSGMSAYTRHHVGMGNARLWTKLEHGGLREGLRKRGQIR
jgi:hypothetical protein